MAKILVAMFLAQLPLSTVSIFFLLITIFSCQPDEIDLEGEHNDVEEGEEQEGEEGEGEEEEGKEEDSEEEDGEEADGEEADSEEADSEEADGEEEEGKQLGEEGANQDQPNSVGKFKAILVLLSLTKVLQILTVAI